MPLPFWDMEPQVPTNRSFSSSVLMIPFISSGLELISVGSFKNAAIMLCGLFVYDVWWVFGTEVMVAVAKVGHPYGVLQGSAEAHGAVA